MIIKTDQWLKDFLVEVKDVRVEWLKHGKWKIPKATASIQVRERKLMEKDLEVSKSILDIISKSKEMISLTDDLVTWLLRQLYAAKDSACYRLEQMTDNEYTGYLKGRLMMVDKHLDLINRIKYNYYLLPPSYPCDCCRKPIVFFDKSMYPAKGE